MTTASCDTCMLPYTASAAPWRQLPCNTCLMDRLRDPSSDPLHYFAVIGAAFMAQLTGNLSLATQLSAAHPNAQTSADLANAILAALRAAPDVQIPAFAPPPPPAPPSPPKPLSFTSPPKPLSFTSPPKPLSSQAPKPLARKIDVDSDTDTDSDDKPVAKRRTPTRVPALRVSIPVSRAPLDDPLANAVRELKSRGSVPAGGWIVVGNRTFGRYIVITYRHLASGSVYSRQWDTNPPRTNRIAIIRVPKLSARESAIKSLTSPDDNVPNGWAITDVRVVRRETKPYYLFTYKRRTDGIVVNKTWYADMFPGMTEDEVIKKHLQRSA